MAIYHLSTKPFSRRDGVSALARAAYRSGSRLEDSLNHQVHDYSRKQGIVYSAIFLPDESIHTSQIVRQNLWNKAEEVEIRKDARTAREIIIALPHELEQDARLKLAQDFTKEIAKKYNIVIDLSIHEPDRNGSDKNHHAHLLLTTRQLTKTGLGEKSDIERSDKYLKEHGKPTGKEQILNLRESWEIICNRSLEINGHEKRISAKSYKARGIEKEATIHIGAAASAMERKGIQTEKGDKNREILQRNRLRSLYKAHQYLLNRSEKLRQEIMEIKREPELELDKQNYGNEKMPEHIRKDRELSAEKFDNVPNNTARDREQENRPLTAKEALEKARERAKEMALENDSIRNLSREELLEIAREKAMQGREQSRDGLSR